MILFLVATHMDGYLNIYLNKCEKEGLNYKILGWNEKWKGFSWKFNLVYENLQYLDDNEIVIFTDAHDVILLKSVDEIYQKFLNYGTPILLSVEKEPEFILHNIGYKKMFPKVLDEFYVNSGMYMGYVWALKNMFLKLKTQYNLQNEDDDQQKLSKFLNNNLDFVYKYCKFDVNNQVFLNLFKSIKPNDLKSCFVHGPGNTNLSNIISYYNLPGKDFRRGSSYTVHVIKSYWKNFIFETILIIFILILLINIIRKKQN
jgi:hypothetical protein